ncbi:Zinc knuckle [Carex littledalei]|uniref:Zinc knuckle n=1 Tax=Carex littledalei TaxID=544730 RepID=A0A833Q7K9_9POAL|nr:Zinc knuckle [Carex littledalei]
MVLNWSNKFKPKLKGHKADLFRLGRCFRCLQQGHKSMNCKSLRRCFNCKGTDHLLKNCKPPPPSQAVNSSIKGDNRFMHVNKRESNRFMHVNNREGQQLKDTKGQSQNSIKERKKIVHSNPSRHHLHHLKNMATPPNWQTMPMQDPTTIQNRINELRVYLPPREEMAEENQFLVRSAIVFAGPHYNDRRIPQRLANALGSYFGITHQNF